MAMMALQPLQSVPPPAPAGSTGAHVPAVDLAEDGVAPETAIGDRADQDGDRDPEAAVPRERTGGSWGAAEAQAANRRVSDTFYKNRASTGIPATYRA